MSGFLAAMLVANSGKKSVIRTDGPSPAPPGPAQTHKVAFDGREDMLSAGFVPFGSVGFIVGVFDILSSPEVREFVSEMAKEELFDTAFRDATAFACLCSERAISRNMEAESAKAFINKLYSLVARRCAGLFGF